jgi:hypothetical protein
VSDVAGATTTANTATTGSGSATTPSLLPGQVSPGRLANPNAANTPSGASTGTTNTGALSGLNPLTLGSPPSSLLGPTTGTGQSAYGYSLPAAGNGSPPESGATTGTGQNAYGYSLPAAGTVTALPGR